MDRGDGRVDAPPDWAERSQGIWPGHSAPPPLALTAQDSVPRRTATIGGDTTPGGMPTFWGFVCGSRSHGTGSCVPSCRWRTSTPPSQEVVPLAADPWTPRDCWCLQPCGRRVLGHTVIFHDVRILHTTLLLSTLSSSFPREFPPTYRDTRDIAALTPCVVW